MNILLIISSVIYFVGFFLWFYFTFILSKMNGNSLDQCIAHGLLSGFFWPILWIICKIIEPFKNIML